MVAGWEGPDEPDPAGLDQLVVVAGVLPGVVDDGQRLEAAGQVAVPGDELLDDGGELGDVGPVAGVGV